MCESENISVELGPLMPARHNLSAAFVIRTYVILFKALQKQFQGLPKVGHTQQA